MPIVPRNRDEVIATVTRISTQTEGDRAALLERLGALVGVDTRVIGQGEGELDSVMAVLMLPAAMVARLLPVGLQLAPNPLSPVGKHPLIVQLSHDHFEFGDMDYDEMLLAVPYVQLSSFDAPRRGPFLYMPRLYLNADLPRLLGVYLYGYEKRDAIIERRLPAGGEGSYRVSDPAGEPLLEATITPDGVRGRPDSFARFVQLRQLLELPTISQAARIWDADAARSEELSPFLASNLVYGFDDPGAWLEPVSVRLEISGSFTPYGLAGRYALPSLAAASLGAFRTSVKLKVALPSAPATLRYPVPKPARRQRVLVLGGGPAACAAAYWMARQTDRYEVHMYTQGFRLGGKCAAGRNPAADARIEEHGLHAFLGFYENAFRTVRSVYRTAGIPIEGPGEGGAIEPLGGAFIGSNQNGLMIELDHQWKYFRTPLEQNDRVPGHVPAEAQQDDGEEASAGVGRPPVSGMGELMVEALRHAARQTRMMERRNVAAARELARSVRAREHEGVLARLRERIRDFADDVADELQWTPAQLVQYIVDYLEDRAMLGIERWLGEGPNGPLRPVLGFVRLLIRLLDEKVDHHPHDDEVWYRWMTLSSVLTAVAGLIEDGVIHLDQLDGEDLWAWFKRHELDPRLLPAGLRDVPMINAQKEGSPAIAAVYETLFAHGKDRAEPRELAAGVGLRWFFLAAIGYAGLPAYEFKYSCPQTLFTPYYKALTGALGAKIHFFHRCTELIVEGEGEDRRLVGVKLQRQATVKGGSHAYDPFLPDPPPQTPAAIPPWPIAPNYDQLVEGARLEAQGVDLESPYSPWPGVGEVELRLGRDFDVCILGIALGALPPLTEALWRPEASTYDPRWKRMLKELAVTQTVSMQLWFDHPESELYEVKRDVDGNEGTGRGLLTGYVGPEPSMGDFTHLLEWEGWPAGKRPKFLAYHTGSLTATSVLELQPFADHGYPARANAAWRARARAWLTENHAGFYHRAPHDWAGFVAWLSVPSNASPNADRFDAQYFNAGPMPSDRYVLSQPKGMPARLGQMESGVAGLYLCGDWTRTDLNCGCVEAATQSGMLCARGLSGHPVYVWHPGV